MRGQNSEAENRAGEHAEPDYAGWKWANFVVLAVILGYLGVKYAAPYFRNESKRIVQDLDDARQRRNHAEVRASEVQRRLDRLGSDIDALREDILRGQAAQADRIRANGETEIARVYANAAQQIEIAGKQARLELQRWASGLALELAERRAHDRMTSETQNSLTRQFVESLRS